MDFVHDEQLYVKVVERTIGTGYTTAAAVCVLVWDWITHLDDEVEFIWRRNWKMAGKPLYLVLRYSGFVFQIFDLMQILAPWNRKLWVPFFWGGGSPTRDPSNDDLCLYSCEGYYVMLPLGTTGLLLIVDTVLAYRMLCLYEMDYRLLVANIVLFSLGAVSTALIIGFCLSGFRVVATPRYLTGCWVTAKSSIFTALIPALAFELWLFVLVLIKLYQHIKEVGGMSQKTITQILLRDSINWFFIISTLILWNAINLAVAPEGLRGIVLPFLRSSIIIGGCRLVIHMRKQMFRHHSISETAVSTAIRFGEREPDDDGHQRSWTKTRVISFAQQIGLPPPATIMSSMWPESEEGSHETESSSGGNEDILLRHLEHNPGRDDVLDVP